MMRGFAYDNPFLRPEHSTYSPVEEGILAHVKSRVIKPFEGRFNPSFKNKYFFRPIKFEFEPNGFEMSTVESFLDQWCSVVLPILRFIDPIKNLIEDTVILTGAFLINSIMTFVLSAYHGISSLISGDEESKALALDNIKQAASNLIIALCMPLVATAAGITDTIRLVTRIVATIADAVMPNNEESVQFLSSSC